MAFLITEFFLAWVLLYIFLNLGKSIMKAEITPKQLIITSAAGAVTGVLPMIGLYLSPVVMYAFLWKLARIDPMPDGALIVTIGKGLALIGVIVITGVLFDHAPAEDYLPEGEVAWVEEDGTEYISDGEGKYYCIDENGEKLFKQKINLGTLLAMSNDTDNMDTSGMSYPGLEFLDEEEKKTTIATANDKPVSEPTSSSPEAPAPVNNLTIEGPGWSLPYIGDSVVRATPQPFKLFVPKGWQVNSGENQISFGVNNHVLLTAYCRVAGVSNNEYLRYEVNRIMKKFSGYEIKTQDFLIIDGKKWAKVHFTDSYANQIMLLTHSNFHGSYTMEVSGTYEQLLESRSMVRRILASFVFPPSNYFVLSEQPEE